MMFYKNEEEAMSKACEVEVYHINEEIDAKDKTYYKVYFDDCMITLNERSCFWSCYFNKCKFSEEDSN